MAFAACHAPSSPPRASTIRRIVRSVVSRSGGILPRTLAPAKAGPGLAVRWLLASLGGVAQYVLMVSAPRPRRARTVLRGACATPALARRPKTPPAGIAFGMEKCAGAGERRPYDSRYDRRTSGGKEREDRLKAGLRTGI